MIEQRRPSEEHSQLTIEEYDDDNCENDEQTIDQTDNEQNESAHREEDADANECRRRPSSKCENETIAQSDKSAPVNSRVSRRADNLCESFRKGVKINSVHYF